MWGSLEFYLFSLICLRYQFRWTWLCFEMLGKFLPAFHGLLFLLKAKYESQTSLKVIAMGLMKFTWTHQKKKKIKKILKGFLISLFWKVKWEMWCPYLVTRAGIPKGPVKDRSAEVLFPFFFLIFTSTNLFLPKTLINSMWHSLLLTTEEFF